MMHSPENGTAGKPAASNHYLRPASEQDREIVRRIDHGDDRHDISHELRISLASIKGAEERVERETRARELLAGDPQSLEGLYLSGQLPGRVQSAFRFHHSTYLAEPIERLSDIAALGRRFVSRLPDMGAHGMATLDSLLARAGLEWSPVEREPKRRAPDPVASDSGVPTTRAEIFMMLGRLQAEIEMQREQIARLRGDDAPRQNERREDLETAGNLVCLPGVKLADVLRDGGAS
jgi:hypothetical protein